MVVTVDYTHTASIADYAYELFNEYGIGSNEKNNGLLLLLSIGDDDYYALQGAGLERTFSSGTLSYLLYEYLEPYFAQQEYDSGVLSVFNAFYDEILAIYDTNIDYEEPILMNMNITILKNIIAILNHLLRFLMCSEHFSL